MKYIFKGLLFIILLSVICLAAASCDAADGNIEETTNNDWLLTGPSDGVGHDEELSFTSEDGTTVEVFYLKAGVVKGCITTITYDSKETADTMYGTFANGSYSDSLSSVKKDGNVIILTYSSHYLEAAFNGTSKDKLIEDLTAVGWTLNETAAE